MALTAKRKRQIKKYWQTHRWAVIGDFIPLLLFALGETNEIFMAGAYIFDSSTGGIFEYLRIYAPW